MSQFEKEVVQAILIADNNVENFRPLSDTNSVALLPIVNVAMLDYALVALNQSGIEEVFIYSSLFLQNVREHIKRGIASLSSWSINMTVRVIGGEGCRCFGDAMRDLDAKALIRGNFILMGADTIMNVDLRPILEQHKKTVKHDKGAAATLIFKEAATPVRTGNELMIAVDRQNNRLHHHQRLRIGAKEADFEVPLEVFLVNAQVALMHNLLDPQIAIGAPSMLSLFSDNFDFATRDDFVRGILINEEILDSRIYVALLPREQYARRVNNWLAYQLVSEDIINRWAYPLVPDMGIVGLSQQYIYWKNNIYKSSEAAAARVALRENVVVQAGSVVDAGCTASCSVVGRNSKLGQNCRLAHAFLMDSVQIGDSCVLDYCVIGAGASVGANCTLTGGTVVGAHCVIPANTHLAGALVTAAPAVHRDCEEEDEVLTKLGDKAYVIDDGKQIAGAAATDTEDDDDNDDADADEWRPLPRRSGAPRMCEVPLTCEDSDYASSSDEDEAGSRPASSIPDDTNIFLSEVMDSLARGYQEKSNPDFLILEINSSRYAYNMSLQEVNFNVVKAIFSLQCIRQPTTDNVLLDVHNVLKQLGSVMLNYIKTDEAMLECLRALEDIYAENAHVREKFTKIVHFLYYKDFISEDAIRTWYDELDPTDNKALRQQLAKLIEWLDQSSDEDSD